MVKNVQKKVVVGLELCIVALLVGAILVYGQVLLQKYFNAQRIEDQKEIVSDIQNNPEVADEIQETTLPSLATPQEKQEYLDSLVTPEPLSATDTAETFNQLNESKVPPLTPDEKKAIFESLE
jgi:hypothetical protein